ncbi:MAG: hypothetical protein ABIV94_09975 [Acidimicrobiales bacterium]
MNVQLAMIRTIAEVLVQRLRDAHEDDRGMTTETVVITALLAIAAIAVVTIITLKVKNKASGIDLNSSVAP